jgi:Transglutaminase-like superfamily
MLRFLRISLVSLAFAFVAITGGVHHASAQAPAAPFDTALETSYEVDLQGNTKITHKFTVTNKTPTTFLKQYGLKLHSTTIENIVVKNNNQDLTPEITKQDNITSISINFPDDVVGEGKRRNFSISYQTPDIADIAGRVLEIHIPPFGGSEQYTSHKVFLYTPIQFGRAVRVTPEQTSFNIDPKGVVTAFDQPTGAAISALFGDEQLYKMTLRYNLENESSSTGIAQIALPPDTPYQRIHIFSLEPPTNDIKVDADGNWIATYKLEPQTKLPVYLTAAVKVTLEPNSKIPVTPPLSGHTESEKYWEVSSSIIQEKIQDAPTAEAVYKKVIDTLMYSYEAVEQGGVIRRQGAEAAFQNPNSAVCQEFTDTFITLARANQIPARRLTGYAYTQNTTLRPLSLESDILHAWPEYYDAAQNRWHQVDPTWEDTTGGIDYFHQFDLSHIVFAINGISSTAPYPAGSYKSAEGDTKDVEVSFTESFPSIKPELGVEVIPTKFLGFKVPGLYKIVVTNKTGQAWYDMGIQIQVSDAAITSAVQGQDTKIILPNQTITLPLQLTTGSWSLLKNTPVAITVAVPEYGNLYESTTELTAGSIILTQAKDPNFIVGMVIGVAIITFGAGSVLVFRRSGKSALRRQSQKPQTTSNFLQLFKKTPEPNPPVGDNSDPTQVQDPGK